VSDRSGPRVRAGIVLPILLVSTALMAFAIWKLFVKL
jgi:hypothetical protein